MPVPIVIAGAWVAGSAFAWLGLRELRKTSEAAVVGVEAISEPIQETTNLALVGVAGLGIYFAYKIAKKGKL